MADRLPAPSSSGRVTPFSVVDGQQAVAFFPNKLTQNIGFLASVLYNRAQGVPTSLGSSCAVSACFSTSLFAAPASFNASARNAFRGPLKKSFALTERIKFKIGQLLLYPEPPQFRQSREQQSEQLARPHHHRSCFANDAIRLTRFGRGSRRIVQVLGKITKCAVRPRS